MCLIGAAMIAATLIPFFAAGLASSFVPDAEMIQLTDEQKLILAGNSSLEKLEVEALVAEQSKPYTVFANRVALWGAFALGLPYVLSAIYAHAQLVGRHFNALSEDPRKPPE